MKVWVIWGIFTVSCLPCSFSRNEHFIPLCSWGTGEMAKIGENGWRMVMHANKHLWWTPTGAGHGFDAPPYLRFNVWILGLENFEIISKLERIIPCYKLFFFFLAANPKAKSSSSKIVCQQKKCISIRISTSFMHFFIR